MAGWGIVITLKRDGPWKVRLTEALLFPASSFSRCTPSFSINSTKQKASFVFFHPIQPCFFLHIAVLS